MVMYLAPAQPFLILGNPLALRVAEGSWDQLRTSLFVSAVLHFWGCLSIRLAPYCCSEGDD
jgi:hypothetical protein